MQQISREQVQSLMRKNASVVEVLPGPSFRKSHLPRAVNVPLDAAFEERIQSVVPDKNTAVIVYCANIDCLLSPKAAERLDRLGYNKVFDYKAGKEDWTKANLPVEGADRAVQRSVLECGPAA